ncbi:glycosyltransferase family 25 protein [Roseateles sp.]|uniref:glycosyltransferase family 25 protein n=1 Tax=Roseateles sp. TaxID=1971397 RepID=UPI00286C6687|nr:glycosyltransferase family 25 protein [Roseateles sp.]
MNYFVINLPRDIERRDSIINEMQKCKLNFSFIEAVDGRLFSAEAIKINYNEEKSIELFNRKMTPGEIGCALSHIKIYNKIVTERLPSAVILEDDICITDCHIEKLLTDLEKIYPGDIPVVVLLNFVDRYESNKNDVMINEKYSMHDSYRSISSSAYFITQAAAKILSENIFPAYVVADKWEYFQEKFFPVKMIIPNCIGLSENSLSSTIELTGDRRKKVKLKFNYKYYLKKNIKTVIFNLLKKPFMQLKRQSDLNGKPSQTP